MKSKVGRKGRYETWVAPKLSLIKMWLNEGATEQQVANKIGIAYSTWNKYKQEHQELLDVCNQPREKAIADLKGALFKKAMGFEYEEKKQYIKRDEDGNEYTYTEITIKQSLPDTTAIFGALNILDENYVKDKANYKLRKLELELKQKQIEKEDW